MSKTAKKALKIVAITLASVVLAITLFLTAVILSGVATRNSCVKAQKNRLESLKTEYAANYTPVDESSFCAFDLNDPALRLDDVQFLATHNSYKQNVKNMATMIFKAAEAFKLCRKNELFYGHESPSDQLDKGVRSMEWDISQFKKKGEIRFSVEHINYLDNASNIPDLAAGFEEVALWSRANPSHMPITLLLECKEEFLLAPFKKVDADGLAALDKLAADTFADMLFTPKQALGGLSDFAQMRQNGWAKLSELKGKVMVILHPYSESEGYINRDLSFESQKMFSALHYNSIKNNPELEKYAPVILVNEPLNTTGGVPNATIIADLAAENFFVRTRTDSYPDYSDERRETSINSGANILSGDFPPRSRKGLYDYVATYENGATMRLRN